MKPNMLLFFMLGVNFFSVCLVCASEESYGPAEGNYGPECYFYYRNNIQNHTELVRNIFEQVPAANILKLCDVPTEYESIHAVSDIEEHNGISYYYTSRLIEEGSKKWGGYLISENEFRTDSTYMCDPSSLCDDYNSSNFVPAIGVTTSAFKDVNDFWNTIVNSESVFNGAVEEVFKTEVYQRSLEKELLPQAVQSLREYLYQKTVEVKIEGVYFREGSGGMPPLYEVLVSAEHRLWMLRMNFIGDSRNIQIMYITSPVA